MPYRVGLYPQGLKERFRTLTLHYILFSRAYLDAKAVPFFASPLAHGFKEGLHAHGNARRVG
ncbi:MAG TPA: hypothetical protein PLC40_14245, partial [Candidatus Hydrogenedentes bacterium]|nr:hypothetical protein [Candidatus Hydrogenedentota bacterium]